MKCLHPPARVEHGKTEELYWRFLAAGIGLAALGMLSVRDRTGLWLQLGGAAAAAAVIWFR